MHFNLSRFKFLVKKLKKRWALPAEPKRMLREKEAIVAWLNSYNIRNYTLIPDEKYGFKVNVAGTVNISSGPGEIRKLKIIPVKFGVVSGAFECVYHKLTSLEGCPDEVGDVFACSYNRLKNLLHSPQKVGNNYYCDNNRLTSLLGAPETIEHSFEGSKNRLKTLEHGPKVIKGSYRLSSNTLDSLAFLPEYIGDNIDLLDNPKLNMPPVKEEDLLQQSFGSMDPEDKKIFLEYRRVYSLARILDIQNEQKTKAEQDMLQSSLPEVSPTHTKSAPSVSKKIMKI